MTIKEAKEDTRKLWSILNEVVDRKQCRHKMPNKFIIDGKSIKSKKNIANAFNAYFASIGTDMADKLPNTIGYEQYLKQPGKDQFRLRAMEEEEVMNIMKHQQPKLSCGVDTINNKIVKQCHKELTEPMTIVINKSIQESRVAPAFKIARIIPLYKKGAANECGNYRKS